MTASPYDRRQLVAARGKLERAHRDCDLALLRLDDPYEVALRVMWATAEAEDALLDLRRYARRHAKIPARAGSTGPAA